MYYNYIFFNYTSKLKKTNKNFLKSVNIRNQSDNMIIKTGRKKDK